MMLFFILLTIGFVFELGKNALKIDSRQILSIPKSINFTYKTLIGSYKSNFYAVKQLAVLNKNITWYK